MKTVSVIIFNLLFSCTINCLFYNCTNAQPIPNCVCASCGAQCGTAHKSTCPYAPKVSSSSSKPVAITPANNMNMMIAGTLMQGLLNGIFSSDQKAQQEKLKQQQLAAQQQQMLIEQEKAKQKKIKDSIENAMYLKLIGSYKLAEGSQKLDFKHLDGDMETMSRNASDQFGKMTIPRDTSLGSNATNFFGTPMTQAEIQTVIDPDKNPVIRDIDSANKFIAENKISDSAKVASLKTDTIKKTEAKVDAKKSIDCALLEGRLNNFFIQRDKFQKTIVNTKNELDEWKKQNTGALWNAAQSGFELVFGKVLENIELKGLQAENIKGRLIPYEEILKGKNVDVDNYKKVLDARIFRYERLTKGIPEFKEAVEYDTYFRDAVQGAVATIAETDTTYNKLLQDPTVKLLSNDAANPGFEAASFITGKTIERFLKGGYLEKLCKFDNKIPYVTYAQFTVDQAYNAYDWYLSYQRITQLHEVSGKETEAAMNLQMHINKTIDLLKDCPK